MRASWLKIAKNDFRASDINMKKRTFVNSPYSIIVIYLMLLSFIILEARNPINILQIELKDILLTLLIPFMLWGWPLLVIKYINTNFQIIDEKQLRWSRFCFYYLVFIMVIPSLVILLENYMAVSFQEIAEATLFPIVTLFAIVSSFSAVIYILWTAAKLLVCAEDEQKKVATSRIFGTFLQFFYLPICVIFLQKRLKKLSDATEN